MIKGYYDVIKCKLNMPTIQPKLQMKEITPSTEEQYIIPDDGYDGLASAIIKAVTNEIDSNILPENIRLGKSILGISGNLEPDKPDQSKTVIPSYEQQIIKADIGYELAQVTVEAVPDETPELNAQDTALINQETVIEQLNSVLNDKIALDLADATSDANATANDIALNKTAYVNGVKLVGTAENVDLSDYFENTISKGANQYPGLAKIVKALPNNITISGVSTEFMFRACSSLTEIPLFNTSNVTNMTGMCAGCSSLTEIPLFDTRNVTNMSSAFSSCSNITEIPLFNTSNVTNMSSMVAHDSKLVTVPLLNTIKCTKMSYMFEDCPRLNNESLNNILAMCINSAVTSNKTLATLGLTSAQATTCQSLSNWDAFVAAGWSTGY